MEFDQLIKRMDWLDEEQRKTKASLAEARDQVTGLINENKLLRKKIKELTEELPALTVLPARVDAVDAVISRQQKEQAKKIVAIEEKNTVAQADVEKRLRGELDGIIKSLGEIQKVKESLQELRREIKGIAEEESRRNKVISTAQTKMETMQRIAEEAALSARSSDSNRAKDSKKITDLQGELLTLRKRLEETREHSQVLADSFKRWDVRINEITASEADRRQAQTTFIESQTVNQLDRERSWKLWQEKIDSLAKQSENIEAQLQNWESAQRAVKHAQELYEEITAKFERRINEITEIQRLGEDRYRQEWVTFKADDQKRWTSFMLTQDETRKDARVEVSRLVDRLTAIEDLVQTLQDVIQQTRDVDEQMLQGILSQIHELLSSYERIKGAA